MTDEVCTAQVTVVNPLGIHARPSHAIVSTVAAYDAQVTLHCNGRSADARSILSVMTLGAVHGAQLELEARGPQAAEAVAALAALIRSGFEELYGK
ncbi:MAG: HPr family phosphocarrier protein [Planctomycetota bacterium]|nr:MAG: HPr family phosphocarrier protein [Planctomycetota bacterium]